ncbi:MAG: DUF308 domain-containing protein [Tannerellaceae bacterium]|jgi:uncharacterized membrane protein HdeD (DUF308 family)|nr:DUF308 domain-containing protein [Tannerellaceae bacterium]
MKSFIEKNSFAIKYWWLSLVLGVLFIIFGIWLLMSPLTSYVALSILFSVSMFISGILEIAFAISNKDNISSWGWYLAGGIIDLIIGVILIGSPGLSMAILPFILAFWLMFRGVSGIGNTIDLRRYGARNWGWYLVLAILAILCSFVIIWMPAAGALSFVFIAAYAFVIFGIFRIAVAFELKKLRKAH